MIIPRETVMAALFNKMANVQIAGNPAFVSKRRNWAPITAVNEAERPCLLMLEDDEDMARARAGMPPGRLTMMVQVLIYAWSAGLLVPSQALNPLIDAVQGVLDPGPGLGIRAQTLGGLTYDAWIAGKIIKVPGYRDGQALAVIPVRVLVP